MPDPTTDPLGWLRETRADFFALLRECGARDAERYFRACEPEAARAMTALPPRHVGLVADLQAECLAALDERLPPPSPSVPGPAPDPDDAAHSAPFAEGVEVPYRDDGTRAEPPPDPGEVCYLLKGRRLPLSDWLWRWREAMSADPPETLAATYHDPDHRDARGQIRRDTMRTGDDGKRRLDPDVEAELVACADLGDGRCGGAIKSAGRVPRPRGGEVPSRARQPRSAR
jgi:hypothetical protein